MDIKLDIKDQSVDYSFLPSLLCQASRGDAYATVTFYAAVMREGYITQGRKRTRLVLLDHNSNGLFDDAVSVRPDGSVAEGDLLLINPNPKKRPSSGADLGGDRNFIGKTVCIGKEFYRMETSPSGSSLKLTPTKFSMGCVVNSSPLYRATLFSPDYGVVVIGGSKDQKISLPEGEWRVLSYMVEAFTANHAFGHVCRQVTGDDGEKRGDGPAAVRGAAACGRHGIAGPREQRFAVAGDRRRQRGAMHKCYRQRNSAAETAVRHQGQGRQDRASGYFRVWMRFYLPALVASAFRNPRRVPGARQSGGRSLPDRQQPAQHDQPVKRARIIHK